MQTIAPTWFARPAARDWVAPASRRGHARSFHAGLPGYAPTPLVDLPALAAELGVAQVLVKDESARLGLPAFKVLGASWACAQVVAGRTGAELDLAALRQAAQGSGLRLVTATDGNHGRAVARMARLLGVTATVFGPAIMTATARQAIVSEGAHFEGVDGNYDDAVRTALAYTQDGAGRQLVQDMAWPGYEQVPAWIVEGYETLAGEIDDALAISPDLVAMPVGVGSLAQAVVTHYRRVGASRPALLAVEPATAACLLASMVAGKPVTVPTGATIMAGLNCGTLSSAAWPVLRAGCDAAVAVADADADAAGDYLARLGISSGPSGAATLAGVRAALTGPGAGARREALRIDASSVVVLLSTEGRSTPITGLYRRACAHADGVIAAHDLETPGSVAHWPKDRRDTTLGVLLIRMVAETAQHAGHADITRELIDGTGGPDQDTIDEPTWRDYLTQVQAAASTFAAGPG